MFQNSAHKKIFLEIATLFLKNYIEKDAINMIETVVFYHAFYFQITLATSLNKFL